jgi:AhpD family alkylhydroperoxidase
MPACYSWRSIHRYAHQEKTMEHALPNTPSSPAQLTQLKRGIRMLAASQAETMQAFTTLHRTAMRPGALNAKTKELIALAIGVAARCDGCIAFHTHDALRAGATEAEIMETLGVAVLMGGGPSVMYATHVIEAMQEFQAESRQGTEL